MNTGPRGANACSPFINAQPERDIDSTPAARPTESSPLWIAWPIEIAADSEDAQKRLKARDVAHTLVRRIHTSRGDVLNGAELDSDTLTCRDHRLAQEHIGPDVRQRAPIAPDRRAHPPEDKSVSHGYLLLDAAIEDHKDPSDGRGASRDPP
jgi:hypothetical protein